MQPSNAIAGHELSQVSRLRGMVITYNNCSRIWYVFYFWRIRTF